MVLITVAVGVTVAVASNGYWEYRSMCNGESDTALVNFFQALANVEKIIDTHALTLFMTTLNI